MFSLDFIQFCENGGIEVQGRLGVQLLKPGGDGAAVHDESCTKAQGRDGVGRIRWCIGRNSRGYQLEAKGNRKRSRTRD